MTLEEREKFKIRAEAGAKAAEKQLIEHAIAAGQVARKMSVSNVSDENTSSSGVSRPLTSIQSHRLSVRSSGLNSISKMRSSQMASIYQNSSRDRVDSVGGGILSRQCQALRLGCRCHAGHMDMGYVSANNSSKSFTQLISSIAANWLTRVISARVGMRTGSSARKASAAKALLVPMKTKVRLTHQMKRNSPIIIVDMLDLLDAEGEPLPEGWKEYFDPVSKRPYYVHKRGSVRSQLSDKDSEEESVGGSKTIFQRSLFLSKTATGDGERGHADESSGNGRPFLLTHESIVCGTTIQNCFCVKSNEEIDVGRHWVLVAKDYRFVYYASRMRSMLILFFSDMVSWMTSITAHIHTLFIQARYEILVQLIGDYIEEPKQLRFDGKGKMMVLSGPSYDNPLVPLDAAQAVATNGVVSVSASWMDNEDGFRHMFYKLNSGQGWVPAQDRKPMHHS
ncbi:unnamed protein product [Sphagnum jensenii]|uniref:WW domain-containing protein n=1 Tax=Sphagnum jensenii TaxID=128206 RepID=A0ABP0V8G7_9BRYO